MSHPIAAVVQDGIKVPKGDFRAYQGQRAPLVLASASEITGMSLGATGTRVVMLDGVPYRYDQADATSTHDGVVVLVSSDGRRYKAASSPALSQGVQAYRKVFEFTAIRAGSCAKRFIHDGNPYIVQSSYKSTLENDAVRIHLETGPEEWDEDAVQTLPGAMVDSFLVHTIGTTVFLWIFSQQDGLGSWEAPVRVYKRAAGEGSFTALPGFSHTSHGASSGHYYYDGSTHRVAMANTYSSTRNLGAGGTYANCAYQDIVVFNWNGTTFVVEDTAAPTRGAFGAALLSTTALTGSAAIALAEYPYYDDLGQNPETFPSWSSLAPQYLPTARVMLYGSAGWEPDNANSRWDIPLEGGAGQGVLFQDELNQVIYFAPGQRSSARGSAVRDDLHFVNEMAITWLLPVGTVAEDIDPALTGSAAGALNFITCGSITTRNSYYAMSGVYFGQRLIIVFNSNAGGGLGSWFDEGSVDVYAWDAKKRSPRRLISMPCPGASEGDAWIRDGKLYIMSARQATAHRTTRTVGSTEAQLLGPTTIFELTALAFKGEDGDPLDVADGDLPFAKLENFASGVPDNNLVVGPSSGGSGKPLARTLTAFLDSAVSASRGTILVRKSSTWQALAIGTEGQHLTVDSSGDAVWGTLYSKGTFTPGIEGATTPGTHTYAAANSGRWRRIGNFVRLWGYLAMSTRDAAMAGQLRLTTGLDSTFNASSSNPPQHGTIVRPVGALGSFPSSYDFMIPAMVGGTTKALLWRMDYDNALGMAGVDAADISGTLFINFDIEYEVA